MCTVNILRWGYYERTHQYALSPKVNSDTYGRTAAVVWSSNIASRSTVTVVPPIGCNVYHLSLTLSMSELRINNNDV